MSATIFVWKPRNGQVGHASMGLADGTYISWWPSGDVHDSPARSYGMRNDRTEEGGIPNYASAPIDGLDEAKISEWWKGVSGRKPGDYSATRHEVRPAVGRFQLLSGANCSNLVVRGLMVGGLAERYPLATCIISMNPVMTPLTLIDVAEAITGNMTDKLASAAASASPVVSTLRSYWQYGLSRKL